MAAIGNCAAHGNFVNGTDGASKNGKGNIPDLEGANESTVSEFCGHVSVDVVRSELGRCQIFGSVFWNRGRQEGKIPPVLKEGEDLVGIEISLKGEFPSGERE